MSARDPSTHGLSKWQQVSKGRMMTFVASPDGLPWPSSTNVPQRPQGFVVAAAVPALADYDG